MNYTHIDSEEMIGETLGIFLRSSSCGSCLYNQLHYKFPFFGSQGTYSRELIRLFLTNVGYTWDYWLDYLNVRTTADVGGGRGGLRGEE